MKRIYILQLFKERERERERERKRERERERERENDNNNNNEQNLDTIYHLFYVNAKQKQQQNR